MSGVQPVSNARSDAIIAPWSVAEHLVYLGARFVWRRNLRDFDFHQGIAAGWGETLGQWSVRERRVELTGPDSDYFVQLGDGFALFRCESDTAFFSAYQHSTELVAELNKVRPGGVAVLVEVQHVIPLDEPFTAAVARLYGTLHQVGPVEAVGGRVNDFAYLTDLMIDQKWHQINIGVVRSHEIHHRTSATTLVTLPPVAIFASIHRKEALRSRNVDLATVTAGVLTVGKAFVEEINKQ
jgi:hypothetical protein